MENTYSYEKHKQNDMYDVSFQAIIDSRDNSYNSYNRDNRDNRDNRNSTDREHRQINLPDIDKKTFDKIHGQYKRDGHVGFYVNENLQLSLKPHRVKQNTLAINQDRLRYLITSACAVAIGSQLAMNLLTKTWYGIGSVRKSSPIPIKLLLYAN